MNSEVRRQSPRGASLKRKSITNNSQMPVARKRKSMLLQHSMSLNIPIDELDQCSGLNCFVDLPDNVFSLTFLTENDTQHPESLQILEDFERGKWEAFFVGSLNNFTYQPAQRKALERAINRALRSKFQDSKASMTYHTQVSRCKALNPTENDSEALKITVTGSSEGWKPVLYEGYLLSWCSHIKESHPFLPLLLCRGNATYKTQVNIVVSNQFDVDINRLTLAEEELKHLFTYCLIMLDENDSFNVLLSYKIGNGDKINLGMTVEPLLRLWKKIHQDDSIDIGLEEVILYHEALDTFYESTFGIKLGNAHLLGITVKKCFCLQSNSQMWFKSTKVIHVVLKYLNNLAIKRLRVKKMTNIFDEGIMDATASDISH